MKCFSIAAVLLCLMYSISFAGNLFTEKPVNPDELYILIDKADTVIVKDSVMNNAKILFKSSDMKDLIALRESLEIETPIKGFKCFCLGTVAVYIYKGEKELAHFSNQHSKNVRCSLWSSDAPVVNTDKWVNWFAERGIPGPREELEESRAQKEKNRKDSERWMAAMPKSIKSIWPVAQRQFGNIDTTNFQKALESEFPDKNKQIIALLGWFGSGAGPWSGFPSYETAPEEMLFGYKTEEIIDVIESNSLSSAQLEGSARFFGGWHFSQKRKEYLKQLPDEIKKTLLTHVLKSDDKDKKSRARNAFAQ